MLTKTNRKLLALFVVVSMIFFFLPSFASEQTATREYAITSFVKAIGEDNLEEPGKDLSSFTDTGNLSKESYLAVSLAVGNSLIKGYADNTLRLNDSILRVEALVILSRALPELEKKNDHKGFDDVPEWAAKDVTRLAEAGIVLGYGDGNVGADDKITVEQVNLLSERLVYYLPKPTPIPTLKPVLPLRSSPNPTLPLGPNTDFYTYVNSKWLEEAEIPSSMPLVSTFTETSDKVSEPLSNYLENAFSRFYSVKDLDNSIEGQMLTFLLSGSDEVRGASGLSVLDSYAVEINKAKSIDELFRIDQKLYYETGFSYLSNFSVEADLINSSIYALYFTTTGSLFTYEEFTQDKYSYLQDAFDTLLFDILRELGYTKQNATESADEIYAFLKLLSSYSLTPEENTDLEKQNNRLTIKELDDLFPEVSIEEYFKKSPVSRASEVIVPHLNYVKKFGELCTAENLDLLKNYMVIFMRLQHAHLLYESTAAIANDFSQAVSGIEEPLSCEQRAIGSLFYYFSTYFERKYVNDHFSTDQKNEVSALVKTIIDEYKLQIADLDWMGEQTKKKAIEKLDSINVMIGHPEILHMAPYPFEFSRTNIVKNVHLINSLYVDYEVSLLGKEVNKKQWYLSAFDVNAYYDPLTNSIVIPAGILQPPFYDFDSTWEEKLGSAGVIIAHEITHALDNSGSQFDKNGNLSDWWTEEDKKNYEKKYQPLIDIYDGFEAVPGYYINGRQCIGENIADLGALSCIINILHKTSDNPDFKLLFESFAKMMRQKSTTKYSINVLSSSSYPTSKERVNLKVLNFNEFYEAYDITEEDPMYLPPEQRIRIW